MENKALKKNVHCYISIILNIVEGLLAGCNFMLLYNCIKGLWGDYLDKGMLIRLTGILAIVFVIRIIIYMIAYTEGQIGGALVSKQIRLYMGDKIKKIPLSLFTKGQTGEYINVATNDINNYEKVLTHKVGDITKNLALSIMLVLFVMNIYFPSGVVILIADLMTIPILWLSFRAVKKYGNEKNNIMSNNVSNVVEYVTGIQTLRSYGIGGTKNKKVTDSMKEYSNISYLYERKVIPIGSFHSVITWLALPIMVLIIGNGFIAGEIDAPTFFLLSILPMFSTKLIGVVFVDLTAYKHLAISKWHIKKLINEKEESGSNKTFKPTIHHIEFENIDFSYDGEEQVLQGVNFRAENQTLTAIVGDSGSGKSTIINLIAKYYEPSSGIIKIGGIPIKDVSAEKVLEHISMVDQDVFLFNDTIKNNIRYARPTATDKEIIEACKLANCNDFIEKLEQGYDTPVGENGNQFSGGERQRLSIARAILKDSDVLLLDEATSSLDIENELAVKQSIANLLKKKKTVIIIAHTLSIIRNADKILVVENGKIKEQGNHNELIKQQGKYYNMCKAEEKMNVNI